jgi:L-threonylcarbamoyladenylate synthase
VRPVHSAREIDNVRTVTLKTDREQDRERAAELLVRGQIIAFPTETVYGLGVRADDAEAVDMLYRIKNRPREKRFTLLVPAPKALDCYGAPSRAARALAEQFWPGPLTLVIPDGEGGDVGLRCPDHDETRDILERAAVPVAAPSANITGAPPACSAAQVMAAFKGRIAALVDGGPVQIGVPSTVVRLTGQGLEVLRPGALDEQQLRAVL